MATFGTYRAVFIKPIRTFFRLNFFAFTAALAREAQLEYNNENTWQKYLPIQTPEEAEFNESTAQSFKNFVGPEMDKHPLKICTLKSKSGDNEIAMIHANIFNNDWFLKIDPKAFNQAIEKGELTRSQQEYFNAVFAHEIIHAKERHTFINFYVSAFMTFSVVHSCHLLFIPRIFVWIFGAGTLLATSKAVERQFEARADKEAVKNQPQVTEALKELCRWSDRFLVSDKTPVNSLFDYMFFKGHPLDRAEALDSVQVVKFNPNE